MSAHDWKAVTTAILLTFITPWRASANAIGSPEPSASERAARDLTGRAEQAFAREAFREGIDMLERELPILERQLGKQHAEILSLRDNLTLLYVRISQADKAEKNGRDVLARRIAANGAAHNLTAFSIFNLGHVFYDRGQFAEAENFYKQALAVWEKTPGPDSEETFTAVGSLVTLYIKLERYDDAGPMIERSLSIAEKHRGSDHPDTASAREYLALTNWKRGRFREAEALYTDVLVVLEKRMGLEHSRVANVLNNMAMMFEVQGRHEEALAVLARSRDIRVKLFGEQSPQVALVLNSMGIARAGLGQYVAAERDFLTSIAIREAKQGKEHPEIANVLSNLANMYVDIGREGEAEGILQRSLAIRSKSVGRAGASYANGLYKLARLYVAQRRLNEAEPLLTQAVALFEKSLEPDDIAVSFPLTALAGIDIAQGRLTEAEARLLRALKIREQVLGRDNAEVVGVLNNLGLLHRRAGEHDEAVAFYTRALATSRAALGPHHPTTGRVALDMASAFAAADRIDDALALMRQVDETDEYNIRENLPYLPEAHQIAYMTSLKDHLDIAVSLQQHAAGRADTVAMTLSMVLHRKGRVLDVVARTRRLALAARGSAALLQRLGSLQAQFAADFYAKQTRLGVDQVQTDMARLRSEIGVIEAELRAATIASATSQAPASLVAVCARLGEGEALLEFVQFRQGLERAAIHVGERGRHHGVYVVDRGCKPVFVDLGDAAAIDAAIAGFLRATASPKSDAVRGLAEALHAKIIAPLARHLHGKRRWIVAPDGTLSLLPFAALRAPGGAFLVEEVELSYIGSGRELVEGGDNGSAGGGVGVRVFADPDFDAPVGSPRKSGAAPRLYFKRLPGTLREAQGLHERLPDAQIVSGAQATETALRASVRPEILHVATHGFFVGGASDTVVAPRDSRGIVVEEFEPQVDTVMLRSGIALAGANLPGGTDDGIVTALELSTLDLRGTRLVVLSACESGMGEASEGEGVLGLRRALAIAGAQTQLISLWRIDDAATTALVLQYYDNLLRGADRSAALRSAQLTLLRVPETAHPYYWGAFVVSGSSDVWSPAGTAGPPPVPTPRGCTCEASTDAPAGSLSGVVGCVLWRRRRR